jgi:hypothetical protein
VEWMGLELDNVSSGVLRGTRDSEPWALRTRIGGISVRGGTLCGIDGRSKQ